MSDSNRLPESDKDGWWRAKLNAIAVKDKTQLDNEKHENKKQEDTP